MPQVSSPRFDISVFDLLAEYLDHGDLISRERFGVFAHDKARTRAEGFELVGDENEFNLLERHVQIRQLQGYFWVTVKPFYYGERYINTGLALPWNRLRLASVLRFLHQRRSPEAIEWFYLVEPGHGALVVDNAIAFYFDVQGEHYYLYACDGSDVGEKPDYTHSASKWVKGMMTPFEGISRMRELSAEEPNKLAALSKIEPYLSRKASEDRSRAQGSSSARDPG